MNSKLLVAVVAFLVWQAQGNRALAQGATFTYQGQLLDQGSLFTGQAEFEFTLWDAPTNGSPVGINSPTTNTVDVANGVFTVVLDFGTAAFAGDPRWLGISVRTNVDPFIPLSPRQPVTASPYAITSGQVTGSVPASQLSGTIASGNIAPASITSAMLAPGSVTSIQLSDGSVINRTLANGSVSAEKMATFATGLLATTFSDPRPAAQDFFGVSVASLGVDRVVIGAYGDGSGVLGRGAAYLFDADGTRLITFTRPTPSIPDLFGYSVAGVGTDKVLVGAPQHSDSMLASGIAYLYRTDGSLLATLANPLPVVRDLFGYSVAAVGSDAVLIGAPRVEVGFAGSAFLFSTAGTLLNHFTSPNPSSVDLFGYAVAGMGSDQVLIGAQGDNTGAPSAGSAYLFNRTGGLIATFHNPAPAANDRFGASVAGVGEQWILVGAPDDDTDASNGGAAYLFNTGGGLVVTFHNPFPHDNDRFGSSVTAVGTDKVLIGAPQDANGTSGGAAYLFGVDGTFLATIGNPGGGTDDQFGNAVAALGPNQVIISASETDVGETDTGAVYLFNLDHFVPGLISQGVVDQAIKSGSLANGAVTAAKLDPQIGLWSADGANIFRATGNVGINKVNPTTALDVNGTVTALAFSSTSDRNAKENFEPVDGKAVLAKVAALPITQWRYRQDSGARHIGPMAQDFHAAFAVGADERHITTVDADGVALAAIQGLNEKVEERDAQIRQLRLELDEVKALLQKLTQPKEIQP